MKLIDEKLFKFLITGIINTILGAGLMFLLYNVFNVNYWISSACNYIFGGICSFLLNKYFTFQNHKKSIIQVLQFICLIIICYLTAYIGAKNLVLIVLKSYSTKLQDNIAMITGMCLYTALNYLGQRCIVFKEDKNE